MLKYSIMAFMVGFTGNKLFNKKNKSTEASIKIGVIVAAILIILELLTLWK